MNRTRKSHLTAMGIAALTVLANQTVQAMPTTVTHQDTPHCDVLNVPSQVDELGRFVFPANELISSQYMGVITTIACPADASPGNVSVWVLMTNLTGLTWSDVWYVGNPQTTFTNVDGIVNGEHAFKIDSGIGQFNNPLILETGPVDGIWQPGESWGFVIDGYFNTAGLLPHQFDQIGVPDFLVPPIASANIIAVELVPEPGAFAMACLAIGGAVLPRRRKELNSDAL